MDYGVWMRCEKDFDTESLYETTVFIEPIGERNEMRDIYGSYLV